MQVVQFLGQALEVADPVRIAVVKSANVDFVKDGILVPERVFRDGTESAFFIARFTSAGPSRGHTLPSSLPSRSTIAGVNRSAVKRQPQLPDGVPGRFIRPSEP